jgi:predicted phage terminase large subunit-like protein
VFYHPNENGKSMPNIILLDAYKEKLEFPDLKRAAYDKYREFEPDQMIVEKKASGAPLIFELRAMGIPVTEFTPSRGQDKIARVNAVTDLFASGAIWYPPRDGQKRSSRNAPRSLLGNTMTLWTRRPKLC